MAEIVSNTLAHFAASRASLLAAENPEAIHQLRVALRRLRGALMMFRRVLPADERDDLRRGARQIASALGPARECDVLRAIITELPVEREEGIKELLAAIDDRRTAAYRQAHAAIENRVATDFVGRAQSFLERSTWRSGLAQAERRRLNGSARKFAKRALMKLEARVRRRGKGFPGLSVRERHKLRIALKNLRYGMDFFGALFGRGRKKQSCLKRVSALQEHLGAQQDNAFARKIMGQLSSEANPGSDKAAGFIIGWLSRDSAIAEKAARKAWKKFRKADPYLC